MRTYRVAILGCRGRGTVGGWAYRAHPRTEVVGLCDLLPERLAALGDALGVKARFDDFDRMIRETSPDIVAIPTGTELHYELGMAVLEHGVHIDIEKPICVDLQQADRLLARAAEKGSTIAVHHQGRSGAAMRAVSKVYRDGRIGELLFAAGSGKGYYGGYGLMNIGTHTINAMLELTGRCTGVSAAASTNGHPLTPHDVLASPSGMGTIAGEHITATLSFPGNLTGTLTQHRFPKVDAAAHSVTFYGTEGRLFWRNTDAHVLGIPHDVPGQGEWDRLPLEPAPGYSETSGATEADYAYVDDFVNALDEDRDPPCSGDAGRHVLEIMMGIFESAAYGLAVTLPQRDRSHPLLRWRSEHDLGTPAPMPRPYGEWLVAEDTRLGRTAG